jgi:hypothetical protein
MTLDVRLLTFPPGTRSAPGRVNSRKTGNTKVIPGPTPKQPFDRITCGLPTIRKEPNPTLPIAPHLRPLVSIYQ